MERRKFLLGSFITAFTLPSVANATNPCKKKHYTYTEIKDLRYYVKKNLDSDKVKELEHIFNIQKKSTKGISESISDDFINGDTLTIQSVLFSKTELAQIVFNI